MNPYSYIMNNPLSGTDPSGYVGEGETEVKVKIAATTGSRLGHTETVTVKASTSADGNTKTVSLSGGSKAAQQAVAGTVANNVAASVHKQGGTLKTGSPASNGGNNQGAPAARANVEGVTGTSGESGRLVAENTFLNNATTDVGERLNAVENQLSKIDDLISQLGGIDREIQQLSVEKEQIEEQKLKRFERLEEQIKSVRGSPYLNLPIGQTGGGAGAISGSLAQAMGGEAAAEMARKAINEKFNSMFSVLAQKQSVLVGRRETAVNVIKFKIRIASFDLGFARSKIGSTKEILEIGRRMRKYNVNNK